MTTFQANGGMAKLTIQEIPSPGRRSADARAGIATADVA